jgi:hypothetical protein
MSDIDPIAWLNTPKPTTHPDLEELYEADAQTTARLIREQRETTTRYWTDTH